MQQLQWSTMEEFVMQHTQKDIQKENMTNT
jgi:hypothetical protein